MGRLVTALGSRAGLQIRVKREHLWTLSDAWQTSAHDQHQGCQVEIMSYKEVGRSHKYTLVQVTFHSRGKLGRSSSSNPLVPKKQGLREVLQSIVGESAIR